MRIFLPVLPWLAILLAIHLYGCASEAPAAVAMTAPTGAAGSAADTARAIAAGDIGLDSEALTRSFALINSNQGEAIYRTATAVSALRCWVMQFCTGGACTNNQFTCAMDGGTTARCRRNGSGASYKANQCTDGPNGFCRVFVDNTLTQVGSFNYGSGTTGSNSVFVSGSAPGYTSARCSPNNGHPTLTLSN